MILVYLTAPDQETAKSIAKYLLKQNLIACANIHPITSLYKWEGEIKDGHEVAVLIKTTHARFEHIKQKILEIHPYKTPCILKMSVEANQEFEKWVKSNIQAQ